MSLFIAGVCSKFIDYTIIKYFLVLITEFNNLKEELGFHISVSKVDTHIPPSKNNLN